jgi:L-threonylcarbamoyladenylate synthase
MTARVIRSDDPDAAALAATALRSYALVGIPTETVYGVAVLPVQDRLEALLEAKRRPAEKGFQMIVDGLDQVEEWVVLSPAAQRLATRFWPGPLTLALPLREGVTLPDLLTGGRRTLGIRVPDHATPRSIARLVGPIAVSSANLSGQPPAETAEEVMAALGEELALVIDDGHVRGGVASTVIGVGADDTLSFFRIGALPEVLVRQTLAGTEDSGFPA